MNAKRLILDGVKTKYRITPNGTIYRETKSGEIKELSKRFDKDGYYLVTLFIPSKDSNTEIRKYCRVCRLVCMAYNKRPKHLKGIPLDKLQVNHKNGVHSDDLFTNLEWCTCKENIEHAWRNGFSTAKHGENHPNAAYTNEQIHQVCKLLQENKLSYSEISEVTNVTYTVIKQIKNKIIWNRISDLYVFPERKRRGKCKKVTEDIVKEICIELERQIPVSKIANKCHVSDSLVSNIKQHKSYTKISKDYNF